MFVQHHTGVMSQSHFGDCDDMQIHDGLVHAGVCEYVCLGVGCAVILLYLDTSVLMFVFVKLLRGLCLRFDLWFRLVRGLCSQKHQMMSFSHLCVHAYMFGWCSKAGGCVWLPCCYEICYVAIWSSSCTADFEYTTHPQPHTAAELVMSVAKRRTLPVLSCLVL